MVGQDDIPPAKGSIQPKGSVPTPSPEASGGAAAAAPVDLKDRLTVLADEAQALADYLSRHGDLSDDGQNGVKVYDTLVDAITAAREQQTHDSWSQLMKAYRAATAITYPAQKVNGKTIRHTRQTRRLDKRNRPLAIGVALFAVAMLLESFAVWLGKASSDAISAELRAVCISLVGFLIPACWGAIGACTFLVKRLTDMLGKQAFDADKLRGDTTRIFLGAMIGAIVVVLFFPQFGKDLTFGAATFGPATAAFLAGLGTKLVYGAFETLVEGLAKRLSGAAPS